jgi:thiamine-monophosphate kinase
LGLALRGVASSAIDLSDGLLGDLGHVLKSSGVGAVIELDALPRSAVLAAQSGALQQLCVLAGGDDYELLFTAPRSQRQAVLAAGQQAGVALTRCGHIEAGSALRVLDAAGHSVAHGLKGFDHFGN